MTDQPVLRDSKARDLIWQALSGLSSGTVPVDATSRSMRPTLWGGELLAWEKQSSLQPGDLIVYRLRAEDNPLSPDLKPGVEQTLVVHRLIGFDPAGRARTKGDGRPNMDVERAAHEDILGRVVAIGRVDRWQSLNNAAARRYGRWMARLSRVHAILFSAASKFDAGLRRLIPGMRDTWIFRRVAWLEQRLAHSLYHRLLFSLCHETLSEQPNVVSEDR